MPTERFSYKITHFVLCLLHLKTYDRIFSVKIINGELTMNSIDGKKMMFQHQIIMIGFGSIGRALLPLLFQNLDIRPSQITIIAADNTGLDIAEHFGITLQIKTINSANYLHEIGKLLHPQDILINIAFDISSASLIELCDHHHALYVDTSTEPWLEDFCFEDATLDQKTNYMIRENTLKLKNKIQTTAIISHGANPGLISHFVKQALLNMAADNGLNCPTPKNASEWAQLARLLEIKVIHVAERDTQICNHPKQPGEFVNTWSVDALIDEGLQPAELGWGTHEVHWPHDAHEHTVGSQCAIYLSRPGASTKVRSWTPSLGAYHGYLITHPETSSIAHFLSLTDNGKVIYRPTIHYAYGLCPDGVISMHELSGNEWQLPTKKRIASAEIIDGIDELGVLLMGNKKGAYWFGSTLHIEEARAIAPFNSATTLQVVAGVLSALLWAIQNPNRGLLEAEDLDHDFIMKAALPYLGKVSGHYTSWTPLENRHQLFSEPVDQGDPWQFINFRVV